MEIEKEDNTPLKDEKKKEYSVQQDSNIQNQDNNLKNITPNSEVNEELEEEKSKIESFLKKKI